MSYVVFWSLRLVETKLEKEVKEKCIQVVYITKVLVQQFWVSSVHNFGNFSLSKLHH